MSRKRFSKLLQRYLNGECTPEEKSFVEHWFALLESEQGESEQMLDSVDLEDRIWQQIQLRKSLREVNEPRTLRRPQFGRYGWQAIAATVALIVGLFALRGLLTEPALESKPVKLTQNDWLEKANSSAKPMLVRLEDGSTVQLAAQSSLRYPKHFTRHQRTVYLTGDAFFSIQKMPSRPFLVYTGDVVTRVLGTSFYVRSKAARQIRVEVVTGRVAVYEQTNRPKADNGVVLTPNQTATFFEEEKHFVTGLVDEPQLLGSGSKAATFRFNDTPLTEVLKALEDAYGIAIEVENEAQYKCPLTADLTNQSLYTKLDLICAALNSTYKIRGTTILLSGKGCTN